MHVRLSPDLSAADSGRWAALSAGSFYSSYEWLRFVAADPAAESGFALVAPADGTPVAGMPYADVRHEVNAFYRWDDLLVARGLDPAVGGRLLLGPRRGYQAHLLGLPDAAPTVPALVSALVDHARAAGRAGALALYVDTGTASALRTAVPHATVLHLADDGWIELPGTGFDDYLHALGWHRRNRVRRELTTFAGAGYQVAHGTLAEVADEVGPLLAATQARYGHPADGAVIARSLAAQGAVMGAAAEVLTLHHEGRMLGFLSYYCHGETLYLRATGFDYAALRGAAEYFNLVYYLPIRLCYERGLRRIHAGIEAVEAKALRGAELRPLWLVDIGPDDAAAGARATAAEKYNADALARLLAGHPAVAAATARAAWLPFVAGSG